MSWGVWKAQEKLISISALTVTHAFPSLAHHLLVTATTSSLTGQWTPERAHCLFLPNAEITRMGYHTQLFYKGFGNLTWVLLLASTLSAKLSPQPQSHNFCVPKCDHSLPHLFYFILFRGTTPKYLHNVHQNISSIYKITRTCLPFFQGTLSLKCFRKTYTVTTLHYTSQEHNLRIRSLPWQFSKLIWVRITTGIVFQSMQIISLQRACLFV